MSHRQSTAIQTNRQYTDQAVSQLRSELDHRDKATFRSHIVWVLVGVLVTVIVSHLHCDQIAAAGFGSVPALATEVADRFVIGRKSSR